MRRPVTSLMIATLLASASGRAYSADFSAIEVRKIFHDYAACVVNGHHKLASEAILADADNSQILSKYSALIDEGCMGRTGGAVQAKFAGDSYRYALADALVSAEFKNGGPTDFADRLPLAHLIPPTQAELDTVLAKTKSHRKQTALKEGFAKQKVVVNLSRYGECIVRQNPVAARYWLLTRPDVPEK